MKRRILAALAGLLLLTGSAWATPVGLELVLLVDVSGSVDSTEYALQKTGYVNAFQSAALQSAILGSVDGSIAVTYVEWSGNNQQSQQVGWTLINSAATANAFAAAIAGTPRLFSGNTAVQDAMMFGAGLFAANGFEGARLVIDVSGDGADNNTTDCNTSSNPACGRQFALGLGVNEINGLPILGESGLLAYYQNYVQGGAGSFTVAVNSFDDFGAAVQDKLEREINPVPEPGTLLLLGGGITALVVRRRARKNRA